MRDNPESGEFEVYLLKVFKQLVSFREFPKYQLERRVDGFVSMFLLDILQAMWDWDTKTVACGCLWN